MADKTAASQKPEAPVHRGPIQFLAGFITSAGLALFCTLVIAALAVGGVINMPLVKVFLALAWVVASGGMSLSLVFLADPPRRLKASIASISVILLAIGLAWLDLWIERNGPNEAESRLAFTQTMYDKIAPLFGQPKVPPALIITAENQLEPHLRSWLAPMAENCVNTPVPDAYFSITCHFIQGSNSRGTHVNVARINKDADSFGIQIFIGMSDEDRALFSRLSKERIGNIKTDLEIALTSSNTQYAFLGETLVLTKNVKYQGLTEDQFRGYVYALIQSSILTIATMHKSIQEHVKQFDPAKPQDAIRRWLIDLDDQIIGERYGSNGFTLTATQVDGNHIEVMRRIEVDPDAILVDQATQVPGQAQVAAKTLSVAELNKIKANFMLELTRAGLHCPFPDQWREITCVEVLHINEITETGFFNAILNIQRGTNLSLLTLAKLLNYEVSLPKQ